MNVLVVGAGGFIGSRLVVTLLSRGHGVICCGRDQAALRRRLPMCRAIEVDLSRDNGVDWTPRLSGVDAVVNAAGVLRGDLDRVHGNGPAALFDACALAGVQHVVQVSALGAGAQSNSFLATKARADDHLLSLATAGARTGWHVVRPSLVIGRGGASTALFSALAAMPWPLRLGSGVWQVQPIHVTDLARAVADLLEAGLEPSCLDLVGPAVMTTDTLTSCLRGWMGLPPRRFIPLPARLLWLGAKAGQWMPGASLTPDSLSMLAAGNAADPAPLDRSLGWRPGSLADALAFEPAVAADRLMARLLPIRGLVVACLVAIWVGSGVASLLVSPQRAGALLAGLGLSGSAAMAVTWGGAILDVLLGLALLRRCRRTVLALQLVVMTTYTLLATVALPGLWLDPFGALLKNLGVLAATLILFAMER